MSHADERNGLFRIVEYDAHSVAATASDAADAMTQIHAIRSANSLHGSVMDGKDHRVTLSERHYFHA